MRTLTRLLSVFCLTCLLSGQVAANGWSNVAINGVRLTTAQLSALEANIGSRIAPGSYLSHPNGCWINLTTGASGCLGQSGSGDVHSRYGSGSRNSNGDWNHWSNAAGAGVGGTGDGCIYTTMGWSNC